MIVAPYFCRRRSQATVAVYPGVLSLRGTITRCVRSLFSLAVSHAHFKHNFDTLFSNAVFTRFFSYFEGFGQAWIWRTLCTWSKCLKVFSDNSSKTLRLVWTFLRGAIREHFLAFTPGAPEAKAKQCSRISVTRRDSPFGLFSAVAPGANAKTCSWTPL